VEQVIVVLAWTLSTVYLLAGLGKILGPGGFADIVVASGEGLLGVFLIVGPFPLLASVVVAVTAVAYCVHAFATSRDEGCSCFGRRLPASSTGVQRARNALLTILALAYLLLGFGVGGSSPASASVLFSGVGVLSGVVVVFAPWVVGWSFTT
jgi:hypothetical protein